MREQLSVRDKCRLPIAGLSWLDLPLHLAASDEKGRDVNDVPDAPMAAVPDRRSDLGMRRGRQPYRHLKNQRFPELLATVAEQIPDGCLLDGEAVLWGGDRPVRSGGAARNEAVPSWCGLLLPPGIPDRSPTNWTDCHAGWRRGPLRTESSGSHSSLLLPTQ